MNSQTEYAFIYLNRILSYYECICILDFIKIKKLYKIALND